MPSMTGNPLDVEPDPAFPLRPESTTFFDNESADIFDGPLALGSNLCRDEFRAESQAALQDFVGLSGPGGRVPVVVLLRPPKDDLWDPTKPTGEP